MYKLKSLLKKVLPPNARRPILNFYHLLEAIVANVKYGFPGRAMKVIMITGTNGKTTTAAYMVKILEAAGYKVGASTTAFYKFGDKTVPNDKNMTVVSAAKLQSDLARMKAAGCEYAVVEITSNALDQHRAWGVPYEVALLTNLTQDHLDYHGTMERYAAAKAKLFANHPKFIVLNGDDEWFDYFNKFEASERKITFGANQKADVQIADVKLDSEGSDVVLLIEGEKVTTRTNLPGKFNVYNATAAAAIGHLLQIPQDAITRGVANLTTVPGRVEPVDEGQNFSVKIDYAHTPDALQNLLDTFKHVSKGRVAIVFGATGDRDKGKRPIMGEIAAKLADQIFLTDDEPYTEDATKIRAAVMEGIVRGRGVKKTTEIADRGEAIAAAIAWAKKGDTVLIAGMGHEQFRMVAGKRLPWSDAEVARGVLRGK